MNRPVLIAVDEIEFRKLLAAKSNELLENTMIKKFLMLGALSMFVLSSLYSDVISNIEEYMKNEGYELVYLQCIRNNGKDYLIMIDDSSIFGGKYFTSDVGYQISSYSFKEGYYFCKKAIMGGISELIDENGRIIRLFMANWTELK